MRKLKSPKPLSKISWFFNATTHDPCPRGPGLDLRAWKKTKPLLNLEFYNLPTLLASHCQTVLGAMAHCYFTKLISFLCSDRHWTNISLLRKVWWKVLPVQWQRVAENQHFFLWWVLNLWYFVHFQEECRCKERLFALHLHFSGLGRGIWGPGLTPKCLN